jgi:hypothetical protein
MSATDQRTHSSQSMPNAQALRGMLMPTVRGRSLVIWPGCRARPSAKTEPVLQGNPRRNRRKEETHFVPASPKPPGSDRHDPGSIFRLGELIVPHILLCDDRDHKNLLTRNLDFLTSRSRR